MRRPPLRALDEGPSRTYPPRGAPNTRRRESTRADERGPAQPPAHARIAGGSPGGLRCRQFDPVPRHHVLSTIGRPPPTRRVRHQWRPTLCRVRMGRHGSRIPEHGGPGSGRSVRNRTDERHTKVERSQVQEGAVETRQAPRHPIAGRDGRRRRRIGSNARSERSQAAGGRFHD
jgi:hypothetical protein